MNKRLILAPLFFFVLLHFLGCEKDNSPEVIESSVKQVKFWVQFTDKNYTSYSINHPEEFLSERAIKRRAKQGIKITEQDLPVSQYYIDSLKRMGVEILNRSKWFNAVTIAIDSSELIHNIEEVSFVNSTSHTAGLKSAHESTLFSAHDIAGTLNDKSGNVFKYGYSQLQIEMLNGNYLHNLGYHGQGIQIALMDVGFPGVNWLSAFDSLRVNNQILGTYDFVHSGVPVIGGIPHGMGVLSVIGANVPGYFVGTAPKAMFFLFRTEDPNSEYPIEEDNWVSAVEYADSAGVDIINTSLGYTTFDDPSLNHSYSDMDGETTRISLAAGIASSKGMIVVLAAGNEGDESWKYIIAPADNEKALTVGGVNKTRQYATFSSQGPTSDGRIKPDIAAMADGTKYYKNDGSLENSSGTSFAAPLITGLAACLWQAYPECTSQEIIEAIKRSGNQYSVPDYKLGYGIPDFERAHQLLTAKK